MTTFLLLNTQTCRVRRIVNRQAEPWHEYDPAAADLLPSLEHFRAQGDVNLPQADIADDPAALV